MRKGFCAREAWRLRLGGPATLLLLGLLLSSCSRVVLGWRVAPWVLEHEGARWLGLTGAERKRFGAEGRRWLQQVGRDLAPELARLSAAVSEAVARGDDAEALARVFNDLPPLWDRLLEPALEPLSGWMTRDPLRCAAALEKVFAEGEARDARRPSQPERLAAERERKMRDGLKDWVGELTPAQEGPLREWGALPYPLELYRADRARRQAALLQRLRSRADAPSVRRELERWWMEPEKDRDPAYEKALQEYRRRSREVGLRILRSLHPAQREYLSRRLRALAEDFAAVARLCAEEYP